MWPPKGQAEEDFSRRPLGNAGSTFYAQAFDGEHPFTCLVYLEAD